MCEPQYDMDMLSNISNSTSDTFIIYDEALLIVRERLISVVILAVCTVIFNLLLLIIVCLTNSPRNGKNVYFISLALADLLVGLCLIVSTFTRIDRPSNPPLPVAWRQIYLITHDSALFISIMSLLLMTLDRWSSVLRPLSYRFGRSRKVALLRVASIWTLGLFLHAVLVPVFENLTILNNGQHVETSATDTIANLSTIYQHSPFCNVIYLWVKTIVQRVLPLLTIFTLNLSLYIRLLQRKNVQIRRSVSSSIPMHLQAQIIPEYQPTGTSASARPSASEDALLLTYQLRRSTCISMDNLSSTERRISRESLLHNHVIRYPSLSPALSHHESFSQKVTPAPYAWYRETWAFRMASTWKWQAEVKKRLRDLRKNSQERADNLLDKQNRQVACWLGLTFVCLLACWLPDTIVTLTSTFYTSIPTWLRELALCLLLANSALNPLLYGLGNMEIRKTLRRRLCRRTSRTIHRKVYKLV